jgi:hypothetical protein
MTENTDLSVLTKRSLQDKIARIREYGNLRYDEGVYDSMQAEGYAMPDWPDRKDKLNTALAAVIVALGDPDA